MLDITVESKGNVIYVNGQKQAWFNLKDLMKFGGPESILEERYKLLYNDRVNKVRNNSSNTNKTKKAVEKPKKEIKNIKKDKCNNKKSDNTKKRSHNRRDNKELRLKREAKLLKLNKTKDDKLSAFEVADICECDIIDFANKIKQKYSLVIHIDYEDLKSELYLMIVEYIKDIIENKGKIVTYRNIGSQLYKFWKNLSNKIIRSFSGYTNAICEFNEEVRIQEQLKDCNLNCDDCLPSEIDDYYTELYNINNTHSAINWYDTIFEMLPTIDIDDIDVCVNCSSDYQSIVENIVIDEDSKEYLWKTVKDVCRLPRDFDIVRLRFCESYTLEKIGNIYGLSRDRIRQIEHRILSRLRHSKQGLFELLHEYNPKDTVRVKEYTRVKYDIEIKKIEDTSKNKEISKEELEERHRKCKKCNRIPYNNTVSSLQKLIDTQGNIAIDNIETCETLLIYDKENDKFVDYKKLRNDKFELLFFAVSKDSSEPKYFCLKSKNNGNNYYLDTDTFYEISRLGKILNVSFKYGKARFNRNIYAIEV